MFSTCYVILALCRANPDADLTEDKLRHAIRRDPSLRPGVFCGRLAWSHEAIARLAAALGLQAPAENQKSAGAL